MSLSFSIYLQRDPVDSVPLPSGQQSNPTSPHSPAEGSTGDSLCVDRRTPDGDTGSSISQHEPPTLPLDVTAGDSRVTNCVSELDSDSGDYGGICNKELHNKLRSVDPQSADRIHPNDRRKVLR